MGPVAVAAGAASAVPLLMKLGGLAGKAYQSKNFWQLLLGGAFLGQAGLGEVGKWRERGLSREQIQLQKLLAESQAIATKRATEGSRERAEKYMKTLVEEKGKERSEAREQRVLEMFTAGQDRQVALLMQAIQGIAQSKPRYNPGQSAQGLVALMRS